MKNDNSCVLDKHEQKDIKIGMEHNYMPDPDAKTVVEGEDYVVIQTGNDDYYYLRDNTAPIKVCVIATLDYNEDDTGHGINPGRGIDGKELLDSLFTNICHGYNKESRPRHMQYLWFLPEKECKYEIDISDINIDFPLEKDMFGLDAKEENIIDDGDYTVFCDYQGRYIFEDEDEEPVEVHCTAALSYSDYHDLENDNAWMLFDSIACGEVDIINDISVFNYVWFDDK